MPHRWLWKGSAIQWLAHRAASSREKPSLNKIGKEVGALPIIPSGTAPITAEGERLE